MSRAIFDHAARTGSRLLSRFRNVDTPRTVELMSGNKGGREMRGT